MADIKKLTATVKFINVLWKEKDGDREMFGAILTVPKDGQEEQVPWELKFWKSDTFCEDIKIGQSLVIEFEKRENTKKAGTFDHWAVSVNGKANPPKGKGGGGGARAYVPKSPAEIHGPAVAHIIAELGKTKTIEEIRPYVQLYRSELSNFQTATSGRNGAS